MSETRHTPGPSPMGMRAADAACDILHTAIATKDPTPGTDTRREIALAIDRETAAPELLKFVEECVNVFAQFSNREGKKGGLAYKMCDKALALRDKARGE